MRTRQNVIRYVGAFSILAGVFIHAAIASNGPACAATKVGGQASDLSCVESATSSTNITQFGTCASAQREATNCRMSWSFSITMKTGCAGIQWCIASCPTTTTDPNDPCFNIINCSPATPVMTLSDSGTLRAPCGDSSQVFIDQGGTKLYWAILNCSDC